MEQPRTRPDFETLKRFTPLAQLTPESLRDVQRAAAVHRVSAGRCLFSAGDTDDCSLFLLDGRVQVTFSDECHEIIAASGTASHLPIAPQCPRLASAHAATDVDILSVPRSLLEVHAPCAGDDGIQVEDSQVTLAALEQRLLEKIFSDYVEQRIEVPVLPDIALRVREILRDENATPQKMADVVSADPSLAARLVQVANSPACRGTVEISGCRDAIARLGLQASHDIVTAMVMSNVFRTESKLLETRMYALWRRSARIAALACILARESGKVSPDRAMLAGLVHDIGAIAVVAGSDAHPELAHEPGALDAAVDALRTQFGSMILRAWEFADDLVAAAVEVDDWQRDSARADCCDLVQVAVVLSRLGTPAFAAAPKLTALASFRKLELGDPTPDGALAVVREADEAITALERTLAP